VGPALGSLRGLDELGQDEAAAQLLQGADPVGPVEDQATIPLRGDDHRVALFPLGLDAPAQVGEAVLVVGLVEDQALQFHEAKVVERGDQVAKGSVCAFTSGVSPAAAPEEVQYEEPAEEEERDHDEEPYDAHKKVECVQSSSPAFPRN
jgi:hypothetical protein